MPISVISDTPTPYRVLCDKREGGCGAASFLTTNAYDSAMRRPDVRWKCPICRHNAWFDDDNYEEQTFPAE